MLSGHKEIRSESMDWIKLAQDGLQWWDVVHPAMNLLV